MALLPTAYCLLFVVYCCLLVVYWVLFGAVWLGCSEWLYYGLAGVVLERGASFFVWRVKFMVPRGGVKNGLRP